jgi:inosine/xanthosine triphosphatase
MSLLLVASTNPVKIQAAQRGFAQAWPDVPWQLEGVSVPSGVADQPMTDAETLQGAQQRVERLARLRTEAAFWVGIEGGLQREVDGLHCLAWVVARRADGRQGAARSASFRLPPALTALVDQGLELGHADDQLFGRENSKQKDGTVGYLTRGLIPREDYYLHALTFALVPFLQEQWYEGGEIV